MEQTAQQPAFKLNYKRTFLIGFAFFGILLLWQVYDLWCPTFLSEMFARAFYPAEYEIYHGVNTLEAIAEYGKLIKKVQYPVGIMMAIDNIAALILMPIFGRLSDKTNTKIGKRMPYILIGTFVCAVAFPFIPVLFHFNQIVGVTLTHDETIDTIVNNFTTSWTVGGDDGTSIGTTFQEYIRHTFWVE